MYIRFILPEDLLPNVNNSEIKRMYCGMIMYYCVNISLCLYHVLVWNCAGSNVGSVFSVLTEE